MSRTAPTGLVVALLGALVGAASPETGPDPDRLVAQLGSPEFRKREDAARALDALGAAALPALQKALAESDDAELNDRASNLHERITRRIENAKLIAPTAVALDVADVPVVDVLAAVEQQTDYKFFLPTDAAKAVREKKVTVRTDGPVPFWSAVDRLCTAAGLRVVGTGTPQPDPRYLAQMDVLGGRAVAGVPAAGAARRPAGAAAPGFVPAVPEAPPAPPAPKPSDPEAKKKADEKQAANEKAARDLAAVTELIKGLEKQAEQIVQPKPDAKKPEAKPAPPPAPAPPIQLRPRPVPNPPALPVPLQALRLQTASTRLAVPPGAANTILLAPAPASSARLPADTTTAVKVEALPGAADHGGTIPADTLLALLQATPEPKLGLEQVTEVRVTRAVADTGRELVANKLGPTGVIPSTAAAELALRRQMLLQQRAVVGNAVIFENGSPVGFFPAGRTLVRLKAPPDGPVAKLAELSGVLVGTVRTPPSEVVAVDDLDPAAGPITYRGHQGATLKAAVTDENIDDTFTLNVEQAYPIGRVAPAVTNRDEALISAVLAKAAREQPQRPAPAAWAQPAIASRFGVLLNGLVLTDAAGTPFRLTATSMRTTLMTQAGERVYIRTFRVTATPTAEDQGKPARLAFFGTWQKTVEVPFTLKDVPVATGAVKR